MVALVSLVVGFCLISATHFSMGSADEVENATCVIKHNLDKRLLQVGLVSVDNPPHGFVLFTPSPVESTRWELIPDKKNKDFFRLRNLFYDHYLTVLEPWCTSYAEGFGNHEDYVWRMEQIGHRTGYMIHNKTNLCMSEYLYEDPELGGYYVPRMSKNCTDSWFGITCNKS